MVVFKGAGVALAGAAVVDCDVAPAALAHARPVDLGTHGTAQILPRSHQPTGWRRLNILRILFLDGYIGGRRSFRWCFREWSDGLRRHGRRRGARRSRGFWFRFRAWRWFRLRHRLGSRRRLRLRLRESWPGRGLGLGCGVASGAGVAGMVRISSRALRKRRRFSASSRFSALLGEQRDTTGDREKDERTSSERARGGCLGQPARAEKRELH
jgi:hypothetical protein